MYDFTFEENEPPLPADYVRRRLGNWHDRLTDLYRQIESWLPASEGYQIDTSQTVLVDELPMHRAGVQPVPVPMLSVAKDGSQCLMIKPDHLWVANVNGRLSVKFTHGFATLVDLAEPLQTPLWTIYIRGQGIDGMPFDQTLCLAMVRAAA